VLEVVLRKHLVHTDLRCKMSSTWQKHTHVASAATQGSNAWSAP
jgi:hypothetical protein